MKYFFEDKNPLLDVYSTRVNRRKVREGCWEVLDVDVLLDGKRVGGYTRNYHGMYNTFLPFDVGGQHYALYSPDYTGTRVLKLPECVDIGGEERCSWGFCPVDYHVPVGKWADFPEEDFPEHNDDKDITYSPYVPTIGFVAGCMWGDDNSWKIEYLDLSLVAEGVIVREDRFGYIELPESMMLRDAISVDSDLDQVTIATALSFEMPSGRLCPWHKRHLGLDKEEGEGEPKSE